MLGASSGATNHWKNTVNRDFPIFSRIYLFFLLILSLLTLLTSAFQLSILSEVSLLNFLRIHNGLVLAYVGPHGRAVVAQEGGGPKYSTSFCRNGALLKTVWRPGGLK